MPKSSRKGQQLVGLFLLGCLLFNYPLIALFNSSAAVFGVPFSTHISSAAWRC
jgi:hypothetical protein